MADETYYSLLGVPETAQTAEIKEAYLRLIRKVHPDYLGNANDFWKSQAAEKAKEVNEARDVLSNPEKRRLYDEQLSAYRRSSGPDFRTSAGPSSNSQSTGSAQGQSYSSATPGNTSGASHYSAQNARSSRQQQTSSTTTPPASSASHSAPQTSVGPIHAGKRFFFACIYFILGLGFALGYWVSTSFGEQVSYILPAIVLFCCVAYLYRGRLRPLLAKTGVQSLASQVAVAIGIIACMVLVGGIPGNQNRSKLATSPRPSANKQPTENQEGAKSNSTAFNADNRAPVGGDFASCFPWYVDTITTMVSKNWYTQDINPETPYGTQTKVSFTIGHDGGVTNIRLAVPSSSPTLDMSARRAVERVTKFGELPSGYIGNAVTVGYTFTFDQTPRLTEGYQPKLVGKAGSSGDSEAPFTPEQLKSYYAVYSAPDVRYLRVLFDAYLAGASGHEGEFEILKQWSPEYYRSKFIVISRGRAVMGGTSIDLIFQQKPDTVFYAWVFNTAGEQPLELRSFEPSDSWAKADISRVRAVYKSLLEDKDHAM